MNAFRVYAVVTFLITSVVIAASFSPAGYRFYKEDISGYFTYTLLIIAMLLVGVEGGKILARRSEKKIPDIITYVELISVVVLGELILVPAALAQTYGYSEWQRMILPAYTALLIISILFSFAGKGKRDGGGKEPR